MRVSASSEVRLFAAAPDGGKLLLATPNHLEDAQLAAAAVNALPLLWRALDAAEARVSAAVTRR